MASCRLMINASISKMQSAGVLGEDMTVKDLNALQAEQDRVSKEYRKLYSKYFTNPIGNIENGILVTNQKPLAYERILKKKGMEKYKGVTHKPFDLIPGAKVILTPDVVAEIFKYGEEADIPIYYDDDIVNLPVGDLIQNDNTLPGFVEFVKDVYSGENRDLLNAYLPGYMVPFNESLQVARNIESTFLQEASKSSLKDVMEGVVNTHGSEALNTINDYVDMAIEAGGAQYQVNAKRHGDLRIVGSAGINAINMDFLNLGLHFATEESMYGHAAKVYVHEKIHILSNGFFKDKAYEKKVVELYEEAKKVATEKGLSFYGISNMYEFVTEGLTDPEFQRFLADIPSTSNPRKSLLQKLIDLIGKQLEESLGVKIDGSVLEELITLNMEQMLKAASTNTKLYNMDTNDYNIINEINAEGVYEGDAPVEELFKWADNINIKYDPIRKVFHLDNFRKTKLSNTAVAQAADYRVGDAYYQAKYGGESVVEFLDRVDVDSTVLPPLVSYYKSSDNLEGSLAGLKEMKKTRVQTPNEDNHNKYMIGSVPHFRATSYLGFSADSTSPLLKNASRIGNIADELSKRVFTEGYGREEYTYEIVNKFVKEEYWGHVKAEDPRADRKEFDKDWKNAVSENSFYELMESLEEMKQRLIDEHDVVEFIPDMVPWDSDIYVAGEIDILARHKDGSFTVIDMKTRRKGVEDYDGAQDDDYNTKTKHTRQTSLYTSMLMKHGFKMNDPMIIMAKPVYSFSPVDNQEFEDIVEGNKLVLIPLKYEENLFDYELDGRYNQDVRNKIESKRAEYRQWFREKTFVYDQLHQTKDVADRDAQVEKLQTELEKIKFKLEEYKTILRKGANKGAMPEGLLKVQAAIEEQLKKDIDKTAIIEQLLIIEDFFLFGEKQLKMLASELSVDTADDIEARQNAYFQIKNYKGVFKVAQDLNIELKRLRSDGFITEEEYQRVKKTFDGFLTLNANLNADLNMKIKELAMSMLRVSYLGSKFEIKRRDELVKEAEEKYADLRGKEKADAIQEYVNTKRRDPKELEKLEQEYEAELMALMNETQYDMSNASFLLLSDPSVNNAHVQIMHSMIAESKQRYSARSNEKLQELAKLEKELDLSSKEIEKLITWSEDGTAFLRGKYKIEFYDEFKKLQEAVREAEALYTEDPTLARLKTAKAKQELALWKKENTVLDEETLITTPKDKWLDKETTNLSDTQKKALGYFSKITLDSHKATGSGMSLIRSVGLKGVYFSQLPGIKMTKYGAAVKGDLKKFYTKAWDETMTQEIDDQEMGERDFENETGKEAVFKTYTTLDGKQSYKVPVFFRGNPKDMQNTDLWTVFALEAQNAIRYSEDTKLANNGTILVDLVNQTKFYKTAGMARQKVVNMFRAKGSEEAEVIDGDASVTSKMLIKMMKNNVYSMTQEYAGTIPGLNIDAHKAAQAVSSYTAFAAMSFKVLSAGNNFVTGNIAAAIEAAGSEFYTPANLKNAKSFYYGNMMGILGDIGKPVKHNIVNQLISHFDVQSEGSALNNEFEKSNKFTQLLEPGTSLAGYQMGEHEIHATIMLAILDGTKVVDRKGRWLTKDGKVTKDQAKAMTILDTYTVEEGVLKQNVKEGVWFSEHDTVNPLDSNGEASMRMLIKDRITRTQGAFDKATASELNRQWWGKLFIQFKKHILPQGLNRWRGAGSVLKSTDSLEDRKKYYNYKAKTEEYGYYTSFFRHVVDTLKAEKWNILGWKQASSDNWKKMTRHQRAGVKKTLAELSYVALVATLAGLAAAAAEDDDDNSTLWAMAYLLRRQIGDTMGQYANPEELWRLTDSPMAAMRHVDLLISTFTQLSNPTADYVSGVNAGENKLLTKAKRLFLLDRLDQFKDNYNKRMHTAVDSY